MSFLIRFTRILLIFLTCCTFIATNVSFATVLSNSDSLREGANVAIDLFCRAEFDYDYDGRDRLLKMSNSYKDKLAKLTTTSIGTLDIPYAYEIFAVKSYKITNLVVNNNEAIATVNYDILAKRTGWKTVKYLDGTTGEAVFVEYKRPNYIEKINLIFDGKRWLVLDPPFPKISINKIVDYLSDDMKFFEKHHPEVKFGKAKIGFQTSYDEDKRNLDLLKKLAAS